MCFLRTMTSLTLIGHLEELRRRLLICVVAWAAGTIAGLAAATRMIEWLIRPARPFLPTLAFFTPTEPLTASLKVAATAGVILSLPVWLAQIWAFVQPGLTPRERRLGASFVIGGSVLFLGGAALGYWTLVPFTLKFLLTFGQGMFEPVISIGTYLSFVAGLLVACGAACELPLAVYLLTRVGLVTHEHLVRWRGPALIVLLVIAAIITPTTDALTLAAVALPLALLYEGSIVVAWLAGRRPIG